MELINKKCKPCEGGIPKLTQEEIKFYNFQLMTPWPVVDGVKISKSFPFKDFIQSIKFVNKLAEIAEAEGHHPVIHVFYSKLEIDLWTHAILGLSENDFILAAKIDEAFRTI